MCKITGSELIFIGAGKCVETDVQSVRTFRWKCNLTKKAKTDTFNKDNLSKIKAFLLNQTGHNYENILKQQKRNKYFKQI